MSLRHISECIWRLGGETSYAQIPTGGESDEEAQPRSFIPEPATDLHHRGEVSESKRLASRKRPCITRALCWLVCVAAIALAMWWLLSFVPRLGNDHPDIFALCYCSSDPAESKAMGCEFEEHLLRWSRPACMDKELSNEFSRTGPGPNGAWTYYPEIDGQKIPTNASELSMLVKPGLVVWYSHEFHIRHCFVLWKKQFRQRRLGTIVDQDQRREKHIQHCEHAVFLSVGLQELTTVVVL